MSLGLKLLVVQLLVSSSEVKTINLFVFQFGWWLKNRFCNAAHQVSTVNSSNHLVATIRQTRFIRKSRYGVIHRLFVAANLMFLRTVAIVEI